MYHLPSTDESDIDILIRTRRSVRTFSSDPLPLEQLSAVLRSSYSALGPDTLQGGQRLLRRPVPSAGGLYPIEIYALVQNVEGLKSGVYHYDSVGDALEAIRPGLWQDQAQNGFLSWSSVQNAPVIVCIGAVFERTQEKYGPRGYRYVLLEAGHVGQNLCLSAAKRGLSTLFLGGFYDHIVNPLIGLDGQEEAIVYAAALGMAD